jgi:hypothetical protein
MLARLLALLVLAYAADPPPPVATLAITHPPDLSLVRNPVSMDVAVDLSSALAYDPTLDVAGLQLCVSLDTHAFSKCWPLLSAAGLPVFDFFASSTAGGAQQHLRSDAATGARQHTLKAWLSFAANGLVVATARADFAAWDLEAFPTTLALRPDSPADLASLPGGHYGGGHSSGSGGGVRLVVRIGVTKAEILADIAQPFSAYLLAAERAVNQMLWPVGPKEAPSAMAGDRTLPLRPPFCAVELPFVRSGDAPGRAFCRPEAADGGEQSPCEAFALVEVMLKVLAAKPLCASTLGPCTVDKEVGVVRGGVGRAAHASTARRRARLLVLGSSSAWVWCGGAESEVVGVATGRAADAGPQQEADLGAGSLWCRGKSTTANGGGSGVDVRVVPGASAMGLNNAHSASGALNEFRKVLRGDFMATTAPVTDLATRTASLTAGDEASLTAAWPPLYDAVVLMVGEVDRSSTLWLKAARRLHAANAANGTAAADTMAHVAAACVEAAKLEARQAAARLVAFVGREVVGAAVLAPHGRVVVMAAPLPTCTRRQMLRRAYSHLLADDLEREAQALAGLAGSSDGDATAAVVEVDASASAAWATEDLAAGTPEAWTAPVERTVADETAVTLALNKHLRRACTAAASCLFADATNDWLDAATGQGHGFFLAAKPDIHAHLERSFFFWKRALVAAGAFEWFSDSD